MAQAKRRPVEVMVVGLGGQGALLFGRLLAEAGMPYYRNVTFFPNYATVLRGGDSQCTVFLTDEEVTSPIALGIQSVIVMSSPSLEEFSRRVLPGGLLILDSSVVSGEVNRGDVTVYRVPATENAVRLGDRRVANLILLGSYLEVTKALPLEAVEGVVARRFAGVRGGETLRLNTEALRLGASLVSGTE